MLNFRCNMFSNVGNKLRLTPRNPQCFPPSTPQITTLSNPWNAVTKFHQNPSPVDRRVCSSLSLFVPHKLRLRPDSSVHAGDLSPLVQSLRKQVSSTPSLDYDKSPVHYIPPGRGEGTSPPTPSLSLRSVVPWRNAGGLWPPGPPRQLSTSSSFLSACICDRAVAPVHMSPSLESSFLRLSFGRHVSSRYAPVRLSVTKCRSSSVDSASWVSFGVPPFGAPQTNRRGAEHRPRTSSGLLRKAFEGSWSSEGGK